MSHYEEQAGVVDARRLEPERAPAQQASPRPAGDPDAELAALQRQLLIYGTAGNPVRSEAETLR